MWVVTDEVGLRVYMNRDMAIRDTELEFYGGLDWVVVDVRRINPMGWRLIQTGRGRFLRRVCCLWKVPLIAPAMHPKMRAIDNYVRRLLQEKSIARQIELDKDS